MNKNGLTNIFYTCVARDNPGIINWTKYNALFMIWYRELIFIESKLPIQRYHVIWKMDNNYALY